MESAAGFREKSQTMFIQFSQYTLQTHHKKRSKCSFQQSHVSNKRLVKNHVRQEWCRRSPGFFWKLGPLAGSQRQESPKILGRDSSLGCRIRSAANSVLKPFRDRLIVIDVYMYLEPQWPLFGASQWGINIDFWHVARIFFTLFLRVRTFDTRNPHQGTLWTFCLFSCHLYLNIPSPADTFCPTMLEKASYLSHLGVFACRKLVACMFMAEIWMPPKEQSLSRKLAIHYRLGNPWWAPWNLVDSLLQHTLETRNQATFHKSKHLQQMSNVQNPDIPWNPDWLIGIPT